MILRPNVVAAAAARMPLEVKKTLSPQMTFGAEALLRQQPAPALTAAAVLSALPKRAANLASGGAKPSTTELERLMGNNDLVDEFYLERALVAARPVMRIVLRDLSGRERGWATGFMVSPHLLLSNWHVFRSQEETTNAIAEAHYVLDIAGNPAPSYRFSIRGDLFYLAEPHLDFSLVAVDPVARDGSMSLTEIGYHRLIAEPHKICEGEFMTLIQHPGGERRQFAIRENQLVKILDQFLWYKSDTAPGSSGAPAFNDSFQVVALHHSGAPRRDNADGKYVLRDGSKVDSLEGIDDSRIDWIANEGLRISELCSYLKANLDPSQPFATQLFESMRGGDVMSLILKEKMSSQPAMGESSAASPKPVSGSVLNIPLQLQISLSLGEALSPAVPQATQPTIGQIAQPTSGVAAEAWRSPYVDRDYTTRTGYQPDFLGVLAPLPKITDESLVSRMGDGNYELPYEHFSIVLNKQRRLPLFTASNVNYSQTKRRPEPGDYSRKGLSGLGPQDMEKWFTDPRIPGQDQLPDVFYTKDGGSFDKGHVVRRDDICWGDSRDQIRRANGDTFHVTNCTPQIKEFNRSDSGVDNWGDLENEIQRQGRLEKLSILAGPILADSDKIFDGRDDLGPVRIRIPEAFWKIVLANDAGKLAAYAFVLTQDLKDVRVEFSVSATWTPKLISLASLERQLAGFSFPPELHAADRSSADGRELATAIGAGIHSSLMASEVMPTEQ